MSKHNSFHVLGESTYKNGTGDDGSSADGEDDTKQQPAPQPALRYSPLRLPLQTATHLLAQRSPQPVAAALDMLDSLLAECTPDDAGLLIQCYAHRGSAHMLLALFACRAEQYGDTLRQYEAAIDDMSTAMSLCHTVPASDEAASDADVERLRRDCTEAAAAVSIELDYTRQLRDQLLAAEARKQALMDRWNEERDQVKSQMGETRWKAQSGGSSYADRRRLLAQQIRELRAVLDRIDETADERNSLLFDARQQVVRPQSRASNTGQELQQRRQGGPGAEPQRPKVQVWRKKQ